MASQGVRAGAQQSPYAEEACPLATPDRGLPQPGVDIAPDPATAQGRPPRAHRLLSLLQPFQIKALQSQQSLCPARPFHTHALICPHFIVKETEAERQSWTPGLLTTGPCPAPLLCHVFSLGTGPLVCLLPVAPISVPVTSLLSPPNGCTRSSHREGAGLSHFLGVSGLSWLCRGERHKAYFT